MMMHFLRMGCLLVLFLSLPVLVGASPFALSGEWKLNANGWMYKLVLLEKGDHLDGMLRPINHQAPDTPLNGRVLGDGRVEFACELGGSSQSFTGYVFQGGEKHAAMAGLFTSQSHSQAAWFAERTGSSSPVPAYQPSYPAPTHTATAIKVFTAATIPMSGSQKAPQLEVQTIFDKTPSYVTPSFSGYITLYPGQKLNLAGNAAGTEQWRVSSFLLVEFRAGHSVQRVVAGTSDEVRYNGQAVARVGARGSYYSPDEIDLTPYVPAGIPVQVTVSALHYGPGIGSVSDLYLIAR